MAGSVPVGYRFLPSDDELIQHYLLRKNSHQDLPCSLIQEYNVYGDKAPWEISEETGQQKFFLFTKLKTTGKSKNRVARSAGGGTWHGNNAGKKIFDPKTNKLIGLKKQFTFKVTTKAKGGSSITKNANWVMNEFSLEGSSSADYVLCEIHKGNKKGRHIQTDSDSDGDDAVAADTMPLDPDDDNLTNGEKTAQASTLSPVISEEEGSTNTHDHQFMASDGVFSGEHTTVITPANQIDNDLDLSDYMWADSLILDPTYGAPSVQPSLVSFNHLNPSDLHCSDNPCLESLTWDQLGEPSLERATVPSSHEGWMSQVSQW